MGKDNGEEEDCTTWKEWRRLRCCGAVAASGGTGLVSGKW